MCKKMSSDSDSDICDFTSDVSKQLLKGANKFWKKLDKIIANQDIESTESQGITDKENIDIKEEKVTCDSTNQLVEPAVNIEEKTPDRSENQIENQSNNDDLDKTKDVENLDINVQYSIMDKLNRLSEITKDILGNNRKRSKKGTRQQQTVKRRSKRKKNTDITKSNLDDNIISDSDEEINPIISRKVNDKELIPTIAEEAEVEELNPTVTVKVLWKSRENHSFEVYKYQTLNCILEHYSEEYNVNSKLLFFTLDDKQIQLEDSSFISLGLADGKVIEGGVLPESFLNNQDNPDNKRQDIPLNNQEGLLKFKVQHNLSKSNVIIVSCKKDDKMDVIYWKVSKCFTHPVENIKLYFDGDFIKASVRISELDIEEGDCFDLKIVNT